MIKVSIIISETGHISRFNEPIALGLPFPRGKIKDIDKLILLNEKNERIPLQMLTLAFWPDKSIKWLLLDFQASVPLKSILKYQLIQKSKFEHFEGISIKKDENSWHINTGLTSFYIDARILRPFTRVVTNDVDVISEESAECMLIGDDNRLYKPVISRISTETIGKLRSTIRIDGNFMEGNRKLLLFFARIHFYYGKSSVKIELTIRNIKSSYHTGGRWDLGDKGSILFKDLTIKIPLKPKDNISIHYGVNEGSPLKNMDKKEVIIYQDSSGGDNWKSTNHKNRFGEIPIQFKGYKIISNDKVIGTGFRASPRIYVGNDKTGITGAIRNFWQNFPKAVHADKNGIELNLFPKEFSDLYELQGGEQKTHTFYLDFGGDKTSLDWVNSPLIGSATPEWYALSRVFPYMTLESEDKEYDQLIDTAVIGGKSFFRKREIIDEYGWRNFGEIYADHEAIGQKDGPPLVSHYNNQYDPIYGIIRQYVMKLEPRWYELMDDLSRHVVDIDIYHTDQDRDEYNCALFWHTDHYLDAGMSTHRTFSKENISMKGNNYGGGPSLEHCYSSGLLYHYYLTGDYASREALVEIKTWVMSLLDGSQTLLGAIYNLKQRLPMIKSILKWERLRYFEHPFNRSTGNAINTLLDLYMLTGENDYIKKIEEVIAGSISPVDDMERRNLLATEVSWSYTVCLQSVGRYLDMKEEIGEIDDKFCFARDSLLNYSRWMIENEYPYLDKPENLEFPNETWPAQDIRKSNVFYYAYKYSDGKEQKAYLEKAIYFYNYTIKKLKEFETKSHTRPIVLLLQNHGMNSYYEINSEAIKPWTNCRNDILRSDKFVSLKLFFVLLINDISKGLKNASVKKEIRWLKSRVRNS